MGYSRDELLNTVYSASEFSLDEGERLLKGMQELREELNKKAPVFAELAARAPDIAPMRQRRLPVTRPMQVTAVCNYTNENVSIISLLMNNVNQIVIKEFTYINSSTTGVHRERRSLGVAR